MNNILINPFAKQIKILTITLFFWFSYSLVYVYFKEDFHSTVSGFMALLGESGLDLALAFMSYFTWKKTNKKEKMFFLFLTITFVSAFFSDFFYNYILNIKKLEMDASIDSLFDIPFSFSLFFFMLSWCSVFMKREGTCAQKGSLTHYLPYTIASIFIFFVFLLGFNWKIKYFSVIGFYQISDTLLEAFGFLFASFCLIRAKKVYIKYMTIGYLVIIGSDFVIRYGVIENKIKITNLMETTWVLGLCLVALGFFFSKERRKMEKAGWLV